MSQSNPSNQSEVLPLHMFLCFHPASCPFLPFLFDCCPPSPHSVNTANSSGACGHFFQAQQKLVATAAVRLNKRFIKNSLSLSKMFYSTRIMQMRKDGKVWEINNGNGKVK